MAGEQLERIQQEESIDIKVIFMKMARYWYLFALTIFVAITVAFLFNKYTNPEYEVSTNILVELDNKSPLDPAAMIGLGAMQTAQSVENEIGKLTAFSLVYRAVKSLDFEITYMVDDAFITEELYQNAPFEIIYDSTIPQAVGLSYTLTFINNNEYTLESEGELIGKYNFSKAASVPGVIEKIEGWKRNYRFGDIVDNSYNIFQIILNDNFDPENDVNKSFHFFFTDYFSLARQFSGVEIEPISRESSILAIKFKTKNKKKGVNYLNMLVHIYLQQSLEKKNKMSENTITFIDNQLDRIDDTLAIAETDLQNFRASSEVMNMDFQSTQVFTYLGEMDKQKAELMVKSNYYKNLKSYILENSEDIDNLVAPSAMGIEDPVLNQLVAELIKLYNTKAEQLLYSTNKSPTVIAINNHIRTTQKAILENISNIINNSDQAINDLSNRIDEYSNKASYLPGTQRQLYSYERTFETIDNIYTFLLQRRTEAQITKASNMPDNEVLDIARVELSSKVFPKTTLNYLIALVLGLAFPTLYVLGKEYFNDLIVERKDIESVTNLPIIGQIIHSSKKTEIVVAESPKSSVSESFRSLRTNIQYMSKGKEKVTIMITADMVSAGKTYVSINLASIYAQYGKKTVLLGFDLRKPKIYQEFGLSNKAGLSSYLINKASLEEIIQPSLKIEHLDIILSGPVPPNPAELIASDRATELFRELREIYDYIVIDTPPVAVVTDALLLAKTADSFLFVMRQGYSSKNVIKLINDVKKDNDLSNIGIILNEVQIKRGYGYSHGYGYGYGYGYGQGYYDDFDQSKNSKIQKIINIFKKNKNEKI